MQQKSAADRFAPLFILTAGAMWGSMGLFVRVLGNIGCSSFEIVFLRSIVTAICLFLVLAVRDRSLFYVRLRDLWCFLGTGLLSIVFFNLCYFTTIRLTSLAVAAVLLYTAPAIVIVLSAFHFVNAGLSASAMIFLPYRIHIVTFGRIINELFTTGGHSDAFAHLLIYYAESRKYARKMSEKPDFFPAEGWHDSVEQQKSPMPREEISPAWDSFIRMICL